MAQIRLVATDPHDVGLEIVGPGNNFVRDNWMNVSGGVDLTRQDHIRGSKTYWPGRAI